jgi:hypothetical protein
VRPSPVTRLLTRHFLRRFFENDLISPHIDLHENAFTAGAAIVSLMLFVSVMLGAKYFAALPLPGIIAVTALGDNYAFIHIAMFATALVATLQWEALSLDVRDVANLGPLPVRRSVLVRAKLSALTIFAVGFALALTTFPTLIYQVLVIVRMPLGLAAYAQLAVAHAVASALACAFAFLTVIAIREVTRAILGGTWFARSSAVVQAILVLVFTTGLLMSPGMAQRASGRWMREGVPGPWTFPPAAFMGVEQTIANSVVANVARVFIPDRMAEPNALRLAQYRAQEAAFRQGASVAVVLTVAMFLVAASAYAWNLRQLPQPAVASTRRRSLVSIISAVAAGRDSVRRAGLSFAMRAIVRSGPHRLAMAGALALATALSVGVLSRVGFREALNPWYPPVSILAVQTIILTLLIAGFRRAVRVPAELPANWVMQLAWKRGERRFLAGVRLASLVGVALPALVLLVPLHLVLLSPPVAAIHFVLGLSYAVALNEALFINCRKVPLASSYQPLSHVKTLGPIVFVLFLIFLDSFARLERMALQSTQGIINFASVWLGVMIVSRAADYWMNRDAQAMKFDEPPEPSTQWLGLTQ